MAESVVPPGEGLSWEDQDATFLEPNILSRVHAWDRQPHSPFDREQLKCQKVWKRFELQPQRQRQDAPAAAAEGSMVHSGTVRTRTIKRLCLGINERINSCGDVLSAYAATLWETDTNQLNSKSGDFQ